MTGSYTVIHKDGTFTIFDRYEDALADLKREYPDMWRQALERAVLAGLLG